MYPYTLELQPRRKIFDKIRRSRAVDEESFSSESADIVRIFQSDFQNPTGKRKEAQDKRVIKGERVPFLVASDYIYIFFKTSSIHGLSHLTVTGRHGFEYLLWVVCIVGAVAGCVYFGSLAWNRYQHDPTVISMQRDSESRSNTSLPSITICPLEKVDNRSFDEWSDAFAKNTSKAAEIYNFLVELSQATYYTFQNVTVNQSDILPDEYMKYIYKFRFPYNHEYNRYILTENGAFVPTFTELGLCYSYNSEVAYVFSPKFFFTKLEEQPNLKKPDINLLFGSTLQGTFLHMINRINTGFRFAYTGPNEIPDSATRMLQVDDGIFRRTYFSALVISSSPDIRTLTPEQRKCRFPDESNLIISHVYSYNICRMECRMHLTEKLCGCVPHFYKKIEGKTTCGFDDLKCLAKHKDLLIKLRNEATGEKVHCSCLSPCSDVNYIIEMDEENPWSFGTAFKWGMTKYPTVILRREIIFGASDLLVSIGGTGGLFLGCSVLSFIEIIYFFTLRLVIMMGTWICRSSSSPVSSTK